MSENTARILWVKAVLGVDLPQPADEAAGNGQGVHENLGDGLRKLKKTVTDGFNTVKNKVTSGVQKVGDTLNKAIADRLVASDTKKFEAAMTALDEQIAKVAEAGLNDGHYKAQAKSLRDDFTAATKLPGNDERVTAVSALVARAKQAAGNAQADIARVSKSAVEGVTSAVTAMRDGAQQSMDKLPEKHKKKAELSLRLSDLDDLIAEVGKLTDRAERAKKLKLVNASAESLFNDAAKAAKDKAIVQEVYAKALKERYGFEIDNPSGMKNTHLEQVYEMFDKVPETDVVQGRMQKLSYQPLDDDGTKNTGAAYGGAEITMGDYGKEKWNYVDPDTGKPVKANGFSISTLHELGHSVDDRFGIMNAGQGKPGAGGWKAEDRKSVATALIGAFTAGEGKALTIDATDLMSMVTKALAGARTKRPPKMSEDDWNKEPKQGKPGTMSDADWHVIETFLDLCFSRRNTEWPWGKAHDIGGRSYHEAYANEWVSYAVASRSNSNTVRDYQWRAPGEYFAELYAFSYFKSKPPPNGIDAGLAAYMFGGKAADKGAPAKH